jgi:hypothetical protein
MVFQAAHRDECFYPGAARIQHHPRHDWESRNKLGASNVKPYWSERVERIPASSARRAHNALLRAQT